MKNKNKLIIYLSIPIILFLIYIFLPGIWFGIYVQSNQLTEDDYENFHRTLHKNLKENIYNYDYLLVSEGYFVFAKNNFTQIKKLDSGIFNFNYFEKTKDNTFFMKFLNSNSGKIISGNDAIQYFNPYRPDGFSTSHFKEITNHIGYCKDKNNNYYFIKSGNNFYNFVKLDKNFNRQIEKQFENISQINGYIYTKMVCLNNKIYANVDRELIIFDTISGNFKKTNISKNFEIMNIETNGKNIFFTGRDFEEIGDYGYDKPILGLYNLTSNETKIKYTSKPYQKIIFNDFNNKLYTIHKENDFNTSLIEINQNNLNLNFTQIPINFVGNPDFSINKDLVLISNVIYNISSNRAIKMKDLYYNSHWINLIDLDFVKNIDYNYN